MAIRIPENNLIVILYLFHFIVLKKNKKLPRSGVELEPSSDLGYFSFMKGSSSFR